MPVSEDTEETMKKTAIKSFLVLAAALLFAVTASAAEVSVSAAASLREAVNALTDNFARKNPGVEFRSNFGASGALAKQIENGAPADLFFSANVEWMDYLKGKKLIDDKSVFIFAYNVLVFAGKPDVLAGRLQDIVRLSRIAIGSPKSVPCGEYTMQALKNAGIEKQVESKLVMCRDVRECLLYADRGEVDGAFVYKTDIELAGQGVGILFTVPQEYYSRVTYPAGLTAAGSRKAEAVAFLKFLRSAEAKKILAERGFAVK
jgi:molybdate transport system substrate-binding protein